MPAPEYYYISLASAGYFVYDNKTRENNRLFAIDILPRAFLSAAATSRYYIRQRYDTSDDCSNLSRCFTYTCNLYTFSFYYFLSLRICAPYSQNTTGKISPTQTFSHTLDDDRRS